MACEYIPSSVSSMTPVGQAVGARSGTSSVGIGMEEHLTLMDDGRDLWGVVGYFFFQAEDGIRDLTVTGVQTCALPIFRVLLATVARSTLPADERLTSFRGGQFEVLQRPYNQVSGVAHAHLHAVVRALQIGRASCRERV